MGRQSSRILINGQDAKQVIACDTTGIAYDIDQIWMCDKEKVLSLAWEKLKDIIFCKIDFFVNKILYGNGIFLAESQNIIYSSLDGINFEKVGISPKTGSINAFYYNGYFYFNYFESESTFSTYKTIDGKEFELVNYTYENFTGSKNYDFITNEYVYPLNGKIVSFIGTETETKKGEINLGSSLYPMFLYSAYESSDAEHYKSINLLNRTYGNSNLVRIPLTINGNMMYKDGHYYGVGAKYSYVFDGINSEMSSEIGIIKTNDFLTCQVIQKEGTLYFLENICFVKNQNGLFYTENFGEYVQIKSFDLGYGYIPTDSTRINSENIYVFVSKDTNSPFYKCLIWDKEKDKVIMEIDEIDNSPISYIGAISIVDDKYVIMYISPSSDYGYIVRYEVEE